MMTAQVTQPKIEVKWTITTEASPAFKRLMALLLTEKETKELNGEMNDGKRSV